MELLLMNEENLRKINVGYEHMTLEALENHMVFSAYLMFGSPYLKDKQVNQFWWIVYGVAFHEAVRNSLQGKEPDIQFDYDKLQLYSRQKNLRKVKECIRQLVKIGLLQPTDKGYQVLHPDINVREWQVKEYRKDMEEYHNEHEEVVK